MCAAQTNQLTQTNLCPVDQRHCGLEWEDEGAELLVEVCYTSGSERAQALEDGGSDFGLPIYTSDFACNIEDLAHQVTRARSEGVYELGIPMEIQAEGIHLPGLMTILSQVNKAPEENPRTVLHKSKQTDVRLLFKRSAHLSTAELLIFDTFLRSLLYIFILLQ